MPGRDGTGPSGRGPMTGWGMGWCSGYGFPGYGSPRRGYGRRHGFPGGRFGWNRPFNASGFPEWQSSSVSEPEKAMQKQFLKQRAEFFQDELNEIKKQLSETESDSKGENT